MQIPSPPRPTPLESVSPSSYELLLTCDARAAWAASALRGLVPQHPAALLGTCFHAVAEAAQRRAVSGSETDVRAQARELFDELARFGHAEAHPLLRAKFPTPEKLPFYNLLRERAVVLAVEIVVPRASEAPHASADPAQVAERRFRSADGFLVGRPDLLNTAAGEIVDYKTGMRTAEPWRVSPREGRQLRLYAYLASEAGIETTRGTIVRGDGQKASIPISKAEAQADAQQARLAGQRYNDSVAAGATFDDLAAPSSENCAFCPCIPLCERFWAEAEPSWVETAGVHLEGIVSGVRTSSVSGTNLVSLEVQAARGTIPPGAAVVEQIPEAWTTADGSPPIRVGDSVRVIDGRVAYSGDSTVIRADRTMTAVWHLELAGPNPATEPRTD